MLFDASLTWRHACHGLFVVADSVNCCLILTWKHSVVGNAPFVLNVLHHGASGRDFILRDLQVIAA